MELFFIFILFLSICYIIVLSEQSTQRDRVLGLNPPNLPDSEIEALHSLYNATNGEHWVWLNATFNGVPWKFTPDCNPCDDDWQGVLCTDTPDDFGNIHVYGLKLVGKLMHGQLPDELGNLTKIEGIIFTTNLLYGTIPSTIGNLSDLYVINLAYNNISGSIPDLSGCSQMRSIYLNNNGLVGRLPDYFAEFKFLQDIYLNKNELTGTLPTIYSYLSRLETFNLGSNRLVGCIPNSYGNLTSLSLFALNSNYFSCELPAALSKLQLLQYIYLDYNGFYGTVPAWLGSMASLLYITMNENYFTGTIPAELALSTSLQDLYLHNNRLTGSIPPELGQIVSLILIDIHGNHLDGVIPAELGNLNELTVLSLFTNYLTGTIPLELGHLWQLQTLDLDQNYITGTIPYSLCALQNLQLFKIHETQIHGPIPECIGNMSSVSYISFHSNHMTSTLPASLKNMTSLNSLFVFNNMFSGSIISFIDPNTQLNLAIVQISTNYLTGEIPDELFALPQLQTVVLGDNCFHGALPVSMCNATKIKTLSMDGLRSGTQCQAVMFPGMSKAYVLTSHIPHGIPACVFAIEPLNTLHMSGNGLTGSLPDNAQISNNLVDLSLSHNKLTGPIPQIFQERVWYNLDLSYNKFKGTLNNEFATILANLTVLDRLGLKLINYTDHEFTFPSSALILRNNRLSHTIPQQIRGMLNISMLQGNLFGCDVQQNDLPRHDDGRLSYSCGSNSFNISYYIFISVLCVCVAVLSFLYIWRAQIIKYIDAIALISTLKKWMSIIDWYDTDSERGKSRLHRYKYVVLLFDEVCKISFFCMMYIVLVIFPVDAVLSKYYGTHSYEYAYSVSAAFLSGVVATAVLFAFFCILLIGLLLSFQWLIQSMKRFLHNLPKDYHFSVLDSFQEEDVPENKYSSLYEKIIVYFVFFLINVTVVGAANTGYVYAAIYAGSSYQTLAQLGLSVFKLIWNNFGSIYLIRWTHHYLAASSSKEWKSKGAGFFAIQLFVQLFNYIMVPCVVVALVSPNCFNNAIVAAPTVESHFYYEQCDVYSALFGCVIPKIVVASTTYSPPFTYSYECSSSLITYYAPTFVYLGFIVTFVSPIWNEVMRWVHIHSPRGTRWFAVVDFWVPPILHPVSADTVQYDKPYDIFNPYIDANYILVTITAYLGVMLTFGFVFPPLAPVMFVAICSTVYTSRVDVGRFLSEAISDGIHKYTDIVESECQGVGSIPKLIQCIRIIVIFMCLFFTPYLFDTLGDQVGIKSAYWVVIVVPLIPLLVLFCQKAYYRLRSRQHELGVTSSRQNTGASVELRTSNLLRSEKDQELAREALQQETLPVHDMSGSNNFEMGTAAAHVMRQNSSRTVEKNNVSNDSDDDTTDYVFNVMRKQ